MEKNIEVIYNHTTKKLIVLENGKMVGGYIGKIAVRLMVKMTQINFGDGDL